MYQETWRLNLSCISECGTVIFYPEKEHLKPLLSKKNSPWLILFTSPKFWAPGPLNHKSGNVCVRVALQGGSGNRGCKLGEEAPDTPPANSGGLHGPPASEPDHRAPDDSSAAHTLEVFPLSPDPPLVPGLLTRSPLPASPRHSLLQSASHTPLLFQTLHFSEEPKR